MKKAGAIILTAVMVMMTMMTVRAVEPAYYYEAQKSVIEVTFTGNRDDWADAEELVINADNKVFQEWGRFQTEPRVATAGELSCTYYIKWDEEYLYIREERLDADGLNNPEVEPSGPWMGDGTAFFFADGKDLTRADVRWIAYAEGNEKNCAVWSQAYGDEVTGEWQCAGFRNGNVYTIEIAMPWSVMGEQLTQEIKEGAEFRFCPIITSRANDEQYGDWTEEVQMNFYDSYIKYDLSNSEEPEYHAGIRLVASSYEAPAADEPGEEAEAEGEAEADTPVVVAPSPRTGDPFVLLLFALLFSAAAVIIKTKNRKTN